MESFGNIEEANMVRIFYVTVSMSLKIFLPRRGKKFKIKLHFGVSGVDQISFDLLCKSDEASSVVGSFDGRSILNGTGISFRYFRWHGQFLIDRGARSIHFLALLHLHFNCCIVSCICCILHCILQCIMHCCICTVLKKTKLSSS